MKIEKKLKDARMDTGLTQEEVADKIMVSRQTISNWENGLWPYKWHKIKNTRFALF